LTRRLRADKKDGLLQGFFLVGEDANNENKFVARAADTDDERRCLLRPLADMLAHERLWVLFHRASTSRGPLGTSSSPA